MTVAPELPPVLARRGGSRRLRVVVDRTPAGVVALVEPARPCGPLAAVSASVVVPAAPVEPGIGREHRPADPAARRSTPDRPRRKPAAGPGRAASCGPAGADVASGARFWTAGMRPVVVLRRRLGTRGRQGRPASGCDRSGRGRSSRGRWAHGWCVPAPGHLRLTRRGRLVTAAATVLIAALTLVGVVSRAGSLRETAPVPASAPAQVVVAPGETLWSIAVRVAPDRDPRPVVAGIQRLNDLPTPDVHAGQTLLLRAP